MEPVNMMRMPGTSSGAQQQDDGQSSRQPKKNDNNSNSNNVRKRTKTGCLTCRKRRIKCDEGRPICANCIKSKRQCEGYAPRVVFKEPLSAAQGPFQPTVFGNKAPDLAQMPGNRPSLTPIAPRPPTSMHQFASAHNSSMSGLDARQRGPDSTAAMGQFDFNSYLAAGGMLNDHHYAQSMPNPLAAANTLSGLPREDQQENVLRHFGTTQYSLQFSPGSQMFDLMAGAPIHGYTAGPYEDDDLGDDDAMSVSDDGLPDPGDQNSRGMQALSALRTGQHADFRKFASFVESGALFLYVDSPANSDLRNIGETTVFSHFISATSPTISLYERHPCDPVEKQEFHTSGHNLWSYTLPVLAFHHPALLNAMLALASFQMANSHGYGHMPYAAMKHYSRAIRRIAKNVNTPSRKTHIATLAATLLLGYFEVWNSNHKHWCKHLNGASSLLREIPLRRQAKLCLPRRRDLERERIKNDPSFVPTGQHDLDYELLTAITGRSISPEDYGLEEDGELNAQRFAVTEKDIEKFENFSDLYWWFCKMDVYQSILGGTKLFMDYKDWAQCPPRAPLAKFGLIYGTYDHLILLLGRVADFASKDLSRKRKAAQSQPSGKPGNTAPSPPFFPGIIPVDGSVPVPLPFGFSPAAQSSPRSEPSDDSDPKSKFELAVEEWQRIRQAFDKLKQSFGADFQPLSMEYADRRESPFGLAVQYRTFSIAGVWMNFYMGLIHLYRAHPSMPPANMPAAGMMARETATWANQIARIAAGLWDDNIKPTYDPLLVGALLESSFCLFVAGVQFQQDAQRHWLVQRMHDVAKFTGWKSATEIATGCETAWTRAAQMGRGPEYTRVLRVRTGPAEPVWQSERNLETLMSQQDGNSKVIVSRSDRAQYALGLLGAEEDLAKLDLRDDDRSHVRRE